MFDDDWDEQIPGDLGVYNETAALALVSFREHVHDTAM
jgi:hypothetical protein